MSDSLLQLAQFVVHTPASAIPAAVMEKAKRHLLDTLGASLAGVDSDIAQACLNTLLLTEPAGDVPVWGGPHRLSARNAALINGIYAHAFELDDAGGCDHSGAVVVPALLAALHLCKTPPTGAELLAAMLMGYEVARRVLEACGGYSPHNQRGWHSTGTCGVFGAAAGCARLLGLDVATTASALALSSSFSGGLWAFIHDGSHSKKLHAGRPAEGGLLAALLAQGGLGGPLQVFEPVWGGFLRTLAGEQAQPEALVAGLGAPWKLERCSIKPYAACRGTHSSIDAVGALLQQLQAQADDIERIDVHASEFLVGMCATRDVDSLAAAQMSLPYAVAVRCVLGHAGLDAYEEQARNLPAVAALMARVHLHIDPQLAALEEPTLVLTTGDGRQAREQVVFALGGPLNPLSDERLLDKFNGLALRALPATQVQALVALCMNLEQCTDVRVLASLLARPQEI